MSRIRALLTHNAPEHVRRRLLPLEEPEVEYRPVLTSEALDQLNDPRGWEQQHGHRVGGSYSVLLFEPSYPLADRARRVLGGAVRRGEIIKPDRCQQCGTEGAVQGHHHDHASALDVEWLCQRCHARRHPHMSSVM